MAEELPPRIHRAPTCDRRERLGSLAALLPTVKGSLAQNCKLGQRRGWGEKKASHQSGLKAWVGSSNPEVVG